MLSMSSGVKKVGSLSFKLEDIHDSASRIELVKIVQCSNCLEIPIRPIFTCENGHVICSSCRNFQPRCGTCMSPVTGTRNRVAENIVMSFVFKCKNREEGCRGLVAWSEILKHFSECPFRPIECNENLRESCRGKMIPYSTFLSHLSDCHNIRKFRALDNISRAIHCNSISQNCSWPLYVISYDEQVFFQNLALDNSTLYVWLTMFSTPDQPHDEYVATVTLKNTAQMLELKSTFPVQPFRSSFREVKKRGCYITLQHDQLVAFSSNNLREESSKQIYKYAWNLYTAISVVSKNGNQKSFN